MRKFWLSDGSTEKALNGENLIWFVYPTGLGAQRGAELANVGNGFFSENGVDFPKQTINGEIRCLKPAYSTYKTFVDWLLNAEELYLLYQPESVQYKRSVSVASLQKTELEGGDWLVCPIVLDCLTPWFTEENLTFSSGSDGVTARVQAGGQIGATVEIKSSSYVDNPSIRMDEWTGSHVMISPFAVASCSAENVAFEYSNHYGNARFIGDTVDNLDQSSLLPYTDMSNPVFGRLKHGKSFQISISPAGEYSGKVRKWWLTV